MVLDAATAVVLICLAFTWWAVPPLGLAGHRRWIVFAAVVAIVAAVRVTSTSFEAMTLASAVILVAFALSVGRGVLLDRRWPAGSLIAIVAVVTAVGAYLRADRLDDLLSTPDTELQPDVKYYQQHALATANPFAAGHKSPLWPALHAPLVRTLRDRDAAMRVLSWTFGVLMIPAVGLAFARLFSPLAGAVVAAMLASDSWLIDLCCQGLREELGVCLWMGILSLLFAGSACGGRRVVGAAVLGGVLLLLRNIDVVPLLAMIVLAGIRWRWRPVHWLAGILLPLMIVAPFYVNQWRAYGDPFAMEKRDARYHANLEFRGRTAPAGLSMPSRQELEKNLFAGEPLSPLAYLVRFHSPGELIQRQWRGISRTVIGEPFQNQFPFWLRLACAAGLLATLVSPAHRFAMLFLLTGLIGMRADLEAMGSLEQRLLLPVMIVWLGAGMWVIVEAVRAGVAVWVRPKCDVRSEK